jgi:hypothetical protein
LNAWSTTAMAWREDVRGTSTQERADSPTPFGTQVSVRVPTHAAPTYPPAET